MSWHGTLPSVDNEHGARLPMPDLEKGDFLGLFLLCSHEASWFALQPHCLCKSLNGFFSLLLFPLNILVRFLPSDSLDILLSADNKFTKTVSSEVGHLLNLCREATYFICIFCCFLLGSRTGPGREVTLSLKHGTEAKDYGQVNRTKKVYS